MKSATLGIFASLGMTGFAAPLQSRQLGGLFGGGGNPISGVVGTSLNGAGTVTGSVLGAAGCLVGSIFGGACPGKPGKPGVAQVGTGVTASSSSSQNSQNGNSGYNYTYESSPDGSFKVTITAPTLSSPCTVTIPKGSGSVQDAIQKAAQQCGQ